MKSGTIYNSLFRVSDIESDRDEDDQLLDVSFIENPAGFNISGSANDWTVSSTGELSKDTYRVILSVSDAKTSIVATYNIEVSDTLVSPSIVTSELKKATQDVEYSYFIEVTDNIMSTVRVESVEVPSWIDQDKARTIIVDSATTGRILLTGRPRNEDVGTVDIIISINDGLGEAVKSYVLEVVDQNDAPTITDLEVESAEEGVEFKVELVIEDPDETDTVRA